MQKGLDISLQVDFDALAESLLQLERRCRVSWESLKAITKHDTKPALKSKLMDFLHSSTQKIVILKVVHRRMLNRSVLNRGEAFGHLASH